MICIIKELEESNIEVKIATFNQEFMHNNAQNKVKTAKEDAKSNLIKVCRNYLVDDKDKLQALEDRENKP